MKYLISLVVAIVLVGCAEYQVPVKTATPKFSGQVPENVIKGDLSGNWSIWRFQDQAGNCPGGRWEAKWCLHKTGPNVWTEANGQGKLYLLKEGTNQQILKWRKPDRSMLYLSINKSSYGHLAHMTGSDGALYAAVRSD